MLIASLLIGNMTGCSAAKPLPEPESAVESDITTENYENTDLNFTASIPQGWQLQSEENAVIWTETSTGTELSVQSIAYTPVINNVTQDNIMSVLGDSGTLTNYKKAAGNTIELAYQTVTGDDKTVQTSAYIKWSYTNIFIVKYVTETKYINHFSSYYTSICDSLTPITDSQTIASGYAGYYNSSTNVYAEYPFSWTFEDFGTGFTVTSSETGSSITLDNAVAITNFAQITEVDYLELMRSSVPNISTTSFANSGNRIIAELYYQDSTAEYYVYNTMIDCTNFTLNITYFAQSDYAQADLPYLESLLNSITW